MAFAGCNHVPPPCALTQVMQPHLQFTLVCFSDCMPLLPLGIKLLLQDESLLRAQLPSLRASLLAVASFVCSFVSYWPILKAQPHSLKAQSLTTISSAAPPCSADIQPHLSPSLLNLSHSSKLSCLPSVTNKGGQPKKKRRPMRSQRLHTLRKHDSTV
eukprot:scaffold198289_cov17-Tisochrysis_lutea.AAC.1